MQSRGEIRGQGTEGENSSFVGKTADLVRLSFSCLGQEVFGESKINKTEAFAI